MLAGGGRTLEDLRVLRNDKGLRALLRLEEMPSGDATGDWLRRMGQAKPGSKESDGLAGLQRVNLFNASRSAPRTRLVFAGLRISDGAPVLPS